MTGRRGLIVWATLACLLALREHQVFPAAVVLLGEPDDFAREQAFLVV